MTIDGIATRDPETRTVRLRTPRPGQDPTKIVTELVVLDHTIGQTVTLTDWRPDSKLAGYRQGEHVTFDLKALQTFQGQLQGEIS